MIDEGFILVMNQCSLSAFWVTFGNLDYVTFLIIKSINGTSAAIFTTTSFLVGILFINQGLICTLQITHLFIFDLIFILIIIIIIFGRRVFN